MARGYADEARAHAIARRIDSDRRPESNELRMPHTQGILRMRASIRHMPHSAASVRGQRCHVGLKDALRVARLNHFPVAKYANSPP